MSANRQNRFFLLFRKRVQALPCPSDADRAGEFSFGRLELGGPTSSRFSAIVVFRVCLASLFCTNL